MERDLHILREMVAQGRAADLRDILYGVSRFSTHDLSPVEPTREETMLWSVALLYLNGIATKDRTLPHPDIMALSEPFREFLDVWLDAGAPFMNWDDLADYLRAHPFEA